MVKAEDSAERRHKVSIWVKLFVLFHIVAITVWALPVPSDAMKQGRITPSGSNWLVYWSDKYLRPFPPLKVYAKFSGFWQYWDMFAPNPSHIDQWGDAEVTFRDGSTKRYQYPRMAELSTVEKFFKERYRKFYERACNQEYVYIWPTFALRIALLNDDPKNPPVTVKLFRHWQLIAEPGAPQPEAYESASYFTYAVDQKELARLRSLD